MLVRLTERQALWVRRAFVDHPGEEIVDEFFEEANRLGHSVDVTLPPDAWHHASRWLFRNVYTVGGGKRPSAGSAGIKAHQRVQRAVNDRRRHPAFMETGVLGIDHTVLTAWRGRKIAPFRFDEPHPTAAFTLMVPVPVRYKGERVTVWKPFAPEQVECSEKLADERLHVPFGHEATKV
jgi:hypothetical protein